MNFKPLISTDNKRVSMSRFGTWLSFILILVSTILYFINIINSETYKAIVDDWTNILLIFIGYQGVSKVSKKITKQKEDGNG